MRVEVKPPRKPLRTFALAFRIPADVKPGDYILEVRAQDEVPANDAPVVEDVKTLLRGIRFLSQRRSDRIIALMRAPDYRVQHKGKGMDNLPISVLSQLLPSLKRERFFLSSIHYESRPVDTGLYITGRKLVRIHVKKKID
jgi:hypothetical protein